MSNQHDDHFDEYGLNPEGVTPLRNRPEDCGIDTINAIMDDVHEAFRRMSEGKRLCAETIFHDKPVIDLQRRYDIHVDYEGAAPKSMQFSAIDRLTYDPDSGGICACIGYGETRREATLDLLAQISGYDEAKAGKP